MAENHANDTEISLLESILEAENKAARLTQRDLAQASGLSLGMTNVLLRRLAKKGLVMLTRLSSRKLLYAITTEGMSEITRRTAGYFQHASQTVEQYRRIIERYIIEKKLLGVTTLVLVGVSDVDFLLEYLCERHGLIFVKSVDLDRAALLAKKEGFCVFAAGKEDRVDGLPGIDSLGGLLRDGPRRKASVSQAGQ